MSIRDSITFVNENSRIVSTETYEPILFDLTNINEVRMYLLLYYVRFCCIELNAIFQWHYEELFLGFYFKQTNLIEIACAW